MILSFLFQVPRDDVDHSGGDGDLWPGQELSKKTMIFVITWPFVVHGIISLANSLRRAAAK